jgi:hypothetical protein
MPFHNDPAPKPLALRVKSDQVGAFARAQNRCSRRVTARVEIALDSIPIELRDAIADTRCNLNRRWRG